MRNILHNAVWVAKTRKTRACLFTLLFASGVLVVYNSSFTGSVTPKPAIKPEFKVSPSSPSASPLASPPFSSLENVETVEPIRYYKPEAIPVRYVPFHLHPDMYAFSKVVQKYNINEALVEPCILWHLLEPNERPLLVRRESVPAKGIDCRKTAFGHNLYSFAIQNTDSPKLIASEVDLRFMGFEVTSYFDPKDNGLTHIVIYKESIIIHVSVIYSRNKWLLIKPIGKLNRTSHQWLAKSDLVFGQFAAAFDTFDTTRITINGQDLLIPGNLSYFLFQIKYSKFIECNETSAEALSKSHPELTTFNKQMDNKVDSSIEMVQMLMKKLLIPLWMDGGTLLGWSRQCGVIPYDHDMDTASFGLFNEDSYELTKEMRELLPKPWALFEIYGFPWEAYQSRIWNFHTGWGIDIFWAYEHENPRSYYLGYHPYPGKMYCRLLYPRKSFDSICSGELNGHKVLVPCHPNLVHEAEYGDKWMVPSKNFVINNGICIDYWRPEETSFAYQCVSDRSGIRESPTIFPNASLIYDREQNNVTQAMCDLTNLYFQLCQDIKLKTNCF